MEANTVTLNNSTVAVEKKMRKPSLPAKFNKFIQFGYFFLQQYNAMDGVTPIDETAFLDKLHLFDTVDNQQNFVQKFFDQSKDINKSIKKLVANKKKADAKAVKLANKPVKKNNKKNNTTSDNTTVTETETETDNFVSEVVSLANPKPKRKYNKKTATSDNAPANDANDATNATNATDELDVEIINILGTDYLIDNNKRIFDFNNHNLIGFLDNNNLLSLY
jgi:cell wall-associated NlpC family hydrolase